MAQPAPPPVGEGETFTHRLSRKLLGSALLLLATTLILMGWTMTLARELDGVAGAINEAGRLRMRSNRIGVECLRPEGPRRAALLADVEAQGQALARLQVGGQSLAFPLAAHPELRARWHEVAQAWHLELAPKALGDGPLAAHGYLTALPGFVLRAEALVAGIEAHHQLRAAVLRRLQAALISLVVISALLGMWLLSRWILDPLAVLERGFARLREGDFQVRVQLEGSQEVGSLGEGFNRLASELGSLYEELERRVDEKTQDLDARHTELSSLYACTAAWAQAQAPEALWARFWQEAGPALGALGAVLWRPEGPLVAGHAPREGSAAWDWIQALRPETEGPTEWAQAKLQVTPAPPEAPWPWVLRWALPGEAGLGLCFGLASGGALPEARLRLVWTLAMHLDQVLERHRLEGCSRQVAVLEERQLLAQGIHDSIAQGLNFLNLKAQMLDRALQQGQAEAAAQSLARLRGGITESYQEVRALLVNFRDKVAKGGLRESVAALALRFEEQSGLKVHWRHEEHEPRPLNQDEELQLLFIIQEALFNVRKHAQATEVHLSLDHGPSLEVVVMDDGVGFSPIATERVEAQVGLHIMTERAERLGAELRINSVRGQGTEVRLSLGPSGPNTKGEP